MIISQQVRELSTHAPELWALRALGSEVLSRAASRAASPAASRASPASRANGEGVGGGVGGDPWIREHLADGAQPSDGGEGGGGGGGGGGGDGGGGGGGGGLGGVLPCWQNPINPPAGSGFEAHTSSGFDSALCNSGISWRSRSKAPRWRCPRSVPLAFRGGRFRLLEPNERPAVRP